MFFDWLIQFSIRNKFLVFLFTIALAGWGIYALLHIPIDAVPDITNNQVQVITYSPNLAPQEIEQFITYPIEIALASTPRLVEIRSLSRFGLSVVTVVLEEDVPLYLARQWLTERLQSAIQQIPPGLGVPELAPPSTGLGEIYQYTLKVDSTFEGKYSLTQLRTYQDWIVKRRLLSVPGVAEVSSFGGFVKQYEVALSPEKMKSYGITFSEVWETLEKNNENTGGAYIEKGSYSYFIRGIGLLRSPKEIEELPVKVVNGVPIRIAQIAKIQEGSAVRYGALTQDGQEACGGIVLMRKGENSAQVTKNIKKIIPEIESSLPPGIKIVPFLDRTRLVDTTIHTVRNNLLEGGLIVILVLVLLLGNLRAGFIVASCIPLSLLFALGMMYLFDISANLMSLGAIDFGLVVDGAVIIVESVLHHLQKIVLQGEKLSRGPELDTLVSTQACRIRRTAAFGEFIIMIVYLPLLTLGGIEGKMFIPMALTVIFAIIGAFILSLTFVPMASALLLTNVTAKNQSTLADRIMHKVSQLYVPLLNYAIKFRYGFLVSIILLFIGTILLFTQLGGQFIPTLEEGDLAMQVSILPGSSLKQSILTTTTIEKLLLRNFPEVRSVVSKIGSSEIPTDPMAIETADIMILLKDKSEWTSATNREDLIAKMEKVLSVLPGVSFSFQQPIQMRFNELMTGTKTDIAIMLYGENLDTLARIADQIKVIASKIEGVADIYLERQTGLPQIAVRYYPEKLAFYGITRQEVNFAIRSAFAGTKAGVIYEGEKKFDLVLRLDTSFRKTIHQVEELYIALPSPQHGLTQVPLSEVASVTYEQGPMQINRHHGKRRIAVGINVRGKDIETVVFSLQKIITQSIKLPVGYYITYGGEFENLKAAKERLLITLPVALSLIFILLYFTLHSFKQTVLIFSAIPLAAIGGVWALWLRDMPFSISAGVGFIALFGVAVLNGIVLMGYFNELQAQGIPPLERIYQGVRVRLRPVLMTALVAALGFLPMAVSTENGAEVQRPLATVVIGGLVSATVLTLFVLPILYGFVHKAFLSKACLPVFMLVCTLIFCLQASSLCAQSKETFPTLSLAQAIERAQQSNLSLRATTLEIEQSSILQKAVWELGKTNFIFTYGNVNEPENDYVLGITHQMPFLNYYRKVQALAKAETQLRQANQKVIANQIAFQVKSIYYEMLFLKAQQKLLTEQDSLFAAYDKAMQVRSQIGDVAPLEAVTIRMRRKEIENAMNLLKAEVESAAWELGRLLGEKRPVFISGNEPLIFSTNLQEAHLEQNPLWEYWRKDKLRIIAQKEVEKARLFPDLTLGFFNQSIYGIARAYNYFQLGIALPLWRSPYKARIQAAEKQIDITQMKWEATALELESTFERAKTMYLGLQNALQYYQEVVLKQASLLLETAQKSYSAGEIDYTELLIAINQVLQTQKSYLDTIRAYNQKVIEIEFLLAINE